MHRIIDYIKKNPIPAAVIGAVGLLILYMLLRGKSAPNTGSGNLAAFTLQEQQLQAGSAAQANATQAQLQAQQNQLVAQQNQVNAQADVAKSSTYAQLIAALAQNQTNAKANQLGADVYNNQIHSEADIYSQYLNEQASLAGFQLNNQYNIAMQELPYVNKIGGSDNKLALLLSLQGNQSGTLGALNTQAQSNWAGAYQTSSIFNTIGRTVGSIVGGLFG